MMWYSKTTGNWTENQFQENDFFSLIDIVIEINTLI